MMVTVWRLLLRGTVAALGAAMSVGSVCAAERLYPTGSERTTFERNGTDKGAFVFNAGERWAASDGYFRLAFDGTARRNFNVYLFVMSYAGENATGPCLSNFVDGFECSAQVPTTRSYDRVYRVEPGSRSVRIVFFDATRAENVRVTAATEEEALSFSARTWSEIDRDAVFEKACRRYPVPRTAFDRLPKFRAALTSGETFRIHLLGDSITQDLFASPFRLLIRRDFPKARLSVTMHAEGSTGCPVYAVRPLAEIVPSGTDLLVICGIDNFTGNGLDGFPVEERPARAAEALARVIRSAQGAGMEVLYVSPLKSYDSRGISDYDVLTDALTSAGIGGRNGGANIWLTPREAAEWVRENDLWAARAYFPDVRNRVLEETHVQGWDVFPLCQEIVSRSGRAYGWFNRDPAHGNVYGREVIARVLAAYVRAAGGAVGGPVEKP